MRLWHRDLIDVLPNKMLLAQWRELSAIVGKINKTGSPNHRLVNILLDYDTCELMEYTELIYNEMKKRNMNPQDLVYKKIANYCNPIENRKIKLFENWHNNRYLKQCFHNLEEKYDRGIITKEEWKKIEEKYKKLRD